MHGLGGARAFLWTGRQRVLSSQAVADLHEVEFSLGSQSSCFGRHAWDDRTPLPTRPRTPVPAQAMHFQKPAAIDAVVRYGRGMISFDKFTSR